MMGLVRGWLLGITGAAILAALADGLMPEGGVKQVGRLVCGLVLLAAVLRPFGSVEVTNLSDQWEYDYQRLYQQKQMLQEEADGRMKAIIEAEMAAYSMDKAAQLGIQCQIKVECQPDGEGAFLPVGAQVSGHLERQQCQSMAQLLEEDLGISPQSIAFREEGPE